VKRRIRFRPVATLRETLSRGRHARPPAAARRCTIAFTDGPSGVEHRVTDEAFATGRRAGGCYIALCGAQVVPARLTAPARFPCPVCERGV